MRKRSEVTQSTWRRVGPAVIVGAVVLGAIIIAVIAIVAIVLSSMKGRETMGAEKTLSGMTTGIPPIDAAAPTETETATFAMG